MLNCLLFGPRFTLSSTSLLCVGCRYTCFAPVLKTRKHYSTHNDNNSRNKKSSNGESSFSHIYKPRRRYVSKMFQNLGKVQPAQTSLSCKSHKLMLYNEIIQQCHPGHYHILPLGMRSLEKLIRVIDEEMDSIGAQKISMPCITPLSFWKKSGRWQIKELYKLKNRQDQEFCINPTHEESVSLLFSYHAPFTAKEAPIMLYQISRKFRDEMAPKYALLRGREFEMKDLYTFDSCLEKAKETYENVCFAYEKIFNRLQVPFVKVEASTGDIGGKISHEFHLPSNIGEDILYICNGCNHGVNKELIDENKEQQCPKCGGDLHFTPGIEVGHAFLLGQKYSSIFNATFIDKNDNIIPSQMGCFGLGVTRILQAGIEVLSLDRQIRWPKLIAPYQLCIIPQKEGYQSKETMDLAMALSDQIINMPNLNGEVVIDDRLHMTIGKRLYEAKRIGYPHIVIVGKRALESPPQFEVILPEWQECQFMSVDCLCQILSGVKTI